MNGRRIKKIFTVHPVMKAISVALAFVLWLFVRSDQRSEATLEVALQFTHLPENLTTAQEVDPLLELALEGPRSRLRQIREKYTKPYVIDLGEARKGSNSFPIDEDRFDFPHGVRVRRVTPSVVRVVLDEAAERLIRVEPQFMGELADGYFLAGYESIPPYLKIRGAANDLERLTAIRTEPIDLEGKSASFEGSYSVRTPSFVQEGSKVEVTVRVRVLEREVSRIVEDVPVVVTHLSRGYRVEPDRVRLSVRGPAGGVSSLLSDRVEVVIDARQLGLERRKQATLRIRPVPPSRAGVEITMNPDNVLLTMSRN